MKHLWTYCAIALLSITCLSAQAGPRTMVVIADLDHGVALIPEGMEVPRGMAVLGRDGKPLPFVHAPESAFTDARDLIAATALRADLPHFVTRDPKAHTGGHPR